MMSESIAAGIIFCSPYFPQSLAVPAQRRRHRACTQHARKTFETVHLLQKLFFLLAALSQVFNVLTTSLRTILYLKSN